MKSKKWYCSVIAELYVVIGGHISFVVQDWITSIIANTEHVFHSVYSRQTKHLTCRPNKSFPYI